MYTPQCESETERFRSLYYTKRQECAELLAALEALDEAWADHPLEFARLVPDETRLMMSAAIAKAKGE